MTSHKRHAAVNAQFVPQFLIVISIVQSKANLICGAYFAAIPWSKAGLYNLVF